MSILKLSTELSSSAVPAGLKADMERTRRMNDIQAILKNKAAPKKFMETHFGPKVEAAFFFKHHSNEYVPNIGYAATAGGKGKLPKFKAIGDIKEYVKGDDLAMTICLVGRDITKYPLMDARIDLDKLRTCGGVVYVIMSAGSYQECFLAGVQRDKLILLGGIGRHMYNRNVYGFAGGLFGTNSVMPRKYRTVAEENERSKNMRDKLAKVQKEDKKREDKKGKLADMKPSKSIFDTDDGAEAAKKALKNASEKEIKTFFDEIKKVKKYNTTDPIRSLTDVILNTPKVRAVWAKMDADEISDIIKPEMLYQSEDKGTKERMVRALDSLDEASGYERGYVTHMSLYNAFDDVKHLRDSLQRYAKGVMSEAVLKNMQKHGIYKAKQVKMLRTGM